MNIDHYDKKGGYAGYNKNHKNRQTNDFYSTPVEEAENILEHLNINFNGKTILEPCAGQGNILKGLEQYLNNKQEIAFLYGSDIYDYQKNISNTIIQTGEEFNCLKEDYLQKLQLKNVNYIITNPPYKNIESFIKQFLKIAQDGVIILARLQCLEGKKRYEEIFKDFPPSDVWIYINRINCPKNGEETNNSSVQAYAWFYWNKQNNKNYSTPQIHWIWRNDKTIKSK